MTTSSETSAVELLVNGHHQVVDVEPRHTLADVLRDELGLTGTRLGCEHGSCGTCTVLVDDEPARACLMFAIQAEGRRIETIESLEQEDGLHPLQTAFVEEGALQCGFCTSGFLMLGQHLLRQRPAPTSEDVRSVVASNLCRCTGYTPIASAIERCIDSGSR